MAECCFINTLGVRVAPASYSATHGVYYADYLKVDTLLSLQQPLSEKDGKKAAHEETLFIIIHQVYELWFKQILHELNSIRDMFAQPMIQERSMGIVVNRLKRCIEILRIAVDQFTILETMTPPDFLEFRGVLSPASGFQSVQFRVLENILGMTEATRVQYQKTNYHTFFADEHQKVLRESEKCDSLLILIVRWLERCPFLKFGEFDFWTSYKAAVQKIISDERKSVDENLTLTEEMREIQLRDILRNEESFGSLFNQEIYEANRERGQVHFSYKGMQAALFIHLYKDEPINSLPHQVLTCLTDIDELLALWRYRHALMVQRMIGVKIGTGGSSGYHYLRTTVGDRYKVFIDLYNLASYLIPRHFLPQLPSTMHSQMDFVWSQALEK